MPRSRSAPVPEIQGKLSQSWYDDTVYDPPRHAPWYPAFSQAEYDKMYHLPGTEPRPKHLKLLRPKPAPFGHPDDGWHQARLFLEELEGIFEREPTRYQYPQAQIWRAIYHVWPKHKILEQWRKVTPDYHVAPKGWDFSRFKEFMLDCLVDPEKDLEVMRKLLRARRGRLEGRFDFAAYVETLRKLLPDPDSQYYEALEFLTTVESDVWKLMVGNVAVHESRALSTVTGAKALFAKIMAGLPPIPTHRCNNADDRIKKDTQRRKRSKPRPTGMPGRDSSRSHYSRRARCEDPAEARSVL